MPSKNKPYEQFGPYVLFKKLETNPLGDLWRAARVDANTIGSNVAIRRLTGGKREAIESAIALARQVAPLLTGPSFVKDQVIDVINGIPFVAHAYAGGRSLRHIVDRARGGNGVAPNPIPLDQALLIAERVALSLGTIGELRFAGERLSHGALIPEFIWISDDGEIRVAGQQLGKGLVASLKDPKSALEIGRYFSPEYQHTGEVTKASEVYSVGAILYLVVTGLEPPDATSTSAFAAAIRAAKALAGTAIPDDIRTIITKSLNLDPAARFASVGDMKQALSALTSGGKYSPTTFNLAMYVSSLLKKELEAEAPEREKESKINLAPYAEALANPPAVAAAPIAPEPEEAKSRMPLMIAAAVIVLALAGAGAWFTLGSKKPAAPVPQPKLASTLAPPKRAQPIIPEPILASPTPHPSAAAVTATSDEAARKKAFEDAVRQKLKEEMMKLQADYTKQLQSQQSKNAPVAVTPAPAPPATTTHVADAAPRPAEERTSELSAAQLDMQRHDQPRAQEAAAPQAPPTATQTPVPAVQTQTQPPAATPTPAAPQIREGDVVDITQVDTVPRLTREPRIVYPPIAARERAEATILTTVLISEKGDVLDVKILRGDTRFGFNDAATRALRQARYTPAVKDGKHVKTWLPQMIQFKP